MTNQKFIEVENSFNKAHQVYFLPSNLHQPAAVVLGYKINDSEIDIKGIMAIVDTFEHNSLTLHGQIRGNKIALSFADKLGDKIVNINPLDCDLVQMSEFVKSNHSNISFFTALISPDYSKIHPLGPDNSPPIQLFLNGFDLI